MSSSTTPVEQVEVERVTEEDAFQCWLEDTPEAQEKRTTELKLAWHPESWLPNKVFVCNKSGEDIIVYVQRSNTEKALTAVEAAASGSLTGLSVSARLEFALSRNRPRLQKEAIKAEQPQEEVEEQQQKAKKRTEKKNVMFAVGARAEGAYITVMCEREPKRLFCVERQVPCGYRLIVRKGTFLDPAAEVPATVVAAAAAIGDAGKEEAE